MFVFVPFASRVTRKGWRTVQVPDGWLQVLRGATAFSEMVQSPRAQFRHVPDPVQLVPPPLRHTSKPPEQVAAHAVGEIERLKAAIAALGDSTAHANPLKEALRVAQARASARPVEERVESCKLFLERARKRVERAQAVVDRAQEQKALHEAEVVEGEARYAKLLAEAAIVDVPPVVSPQVTELQEQINALVLERDALRAAPVICGIPKEAQGTWMGDLPRVEDIPPMPTSDMQDLAGWMSQRNCELRNAMEFGDHVLVAKIGSLVGQGASLFSTAVRDVPMEGKDRSSLMLNLIDGADAKRRCVTPGSACGTMQ